MVVGVAVGFAAIFFVAELINRISFGLGGDFDVFWRAARLPVQRAYAELPFAHPPSALPLIEASTILPFWPAYVLFTLLSAAFFYWAGRRLYSRTAVLMGLASPAMLWALAEGQMAPLLAGAMFLASTSPSILKGALVAVVLSIKPQFAFVAPLVLWSDRKAFLSMTATGASLLAGHIAFWGIETWEAWYESLARFHIVSQSGNVAPKVISFAGEARNYGLPALPALAVALAISAYVAIRKPIDDLAVLIVGSSIFAAPYALPYDLVAIAPWAAERLLKDRVDGWLAPKVLLYIHFLFPLAWLLTVLPARKVLRHQRTLSRQQH